MVRIPGFHFWGLSSISGLGTEISEVCMVWPKKGKKKSEYKMLMVYQTAVMAVSASDYWAGTVLDAFSTYVVFNLHIV